jgi:hypothetical protein
MKFAVGVALFAALSAGKAAMAQDSTGVKTYRFDAAVPVQPCNWDGGSVSGQTLDAAPSGAQFRVLKEISAGSVAGVTGPRLLIQFLRWRGDDTSELNQRLHFAREGAAVWSQGSVRPVGSFCVLKGDVEALATRTYATLYRTYYVVPRGFKRATSLTSGLLVLPIKVRPAGAGRPFDFSRDITLGTVAGPRMRLSPTAPMFLDALLGVGITSTRLDPNSTRDQVETPVDRAALTWTFGLMFEVNSFQFGLHTGKDYISNPNQRDWVYQGKRWYAIGLGYNLLSSAPKAASDR